MRVFISWSGEKSKQVGQAISNWLPNVNQRVDVFFSPNDIEKGAKWSNEIDLQLRDTRFCLVCLTAEALNSAWINFETGAISKGIGQNRIIPILLDIKKSDVNGPLSTFQLASFEREEMLQTLFALNQSFDGERVGDEILKRAFERWWPDIEKDVNLILQTPQSKIPDLKPKRELIEEIFLNTREILKEIGQLGSVYKDTTLDNLRAKDLHIVNMNRTINRLFRHIKLNDQKRAMILIKKLGVQILRLNKMSGKTDGDSLLRLREWVGPEFESNLSVKNSTLGDVFKEVLRIL